MLRHSFPDHYRFEKADFDALGFDDIQPIVMTEKDAVKVTNFARHNFWYLSIRIRLPEHLLAVFDKRLAAVLAKKAKAP